MNMSDEGQSILIVDDEFSVRDSLFHWFKKEGFRAGAAEDAKAALRELSAQNWDVVLLDIKMPGMDGIELLSRARKVAPDTVYLMLTAHGTHRNGGRSAEVRGLRLPHQARGSG